MFYVYNVIYYVFMFLCIRCFCVPCSNRWVKKMIMYPFFLCLLCLPAITPPPPHPTRMNPSNKKRQNRNKITTFVVVVRNICCCFMLPCNIKRKRGKMKKKMWNIKYKWYIHIFPHLGWVFCATPFFLFFCYSKDCAKHK